MFNWEISQNELDGKWSNKEFVLSKLSNRHLAEKQIDEIYKLIDKSLIEDNDFLIDCIIKNNKFKNKIIDEQKERLESPEMIEALSKNLWGFYQLWDSKYRYYKDNNELINSLIFNDKDKILTLMDLDIDFYYHINKNFQLEPSIYIEFLKQSQDSSSMSLPIQLMKNKEAVMHFLAKGFSFGSHPKEDTKKIAINLKPDKEFFDEFVDFLGRNSWANIDKMSHIFYLFEADFAKDKDFLLKALEILPCIFINLPKDLIDKDVLDLVLKTSLDRNAIVKSISLTAFKKLVSSENENLIKELIKLDENYYESLPSSWRQRSDIIRELSPKTICYFLHWGYGSSSKKYLIKELNDESWRKKLIESYPEIYKDLPSELKKSIEDALIYAKNAKEQRDFHHNIPKEFWKNTEFCSKIIETMRNPNIISSIDEIVWKDEQFILSFFKQIDNGTTKINTIKEHLPMKVLNYLETYGINESYEAFFRAAILRKSLDESIEKQSKVSKKLKM